MTGIIKFLAGVNAKVWVYLSLAVIGIAMTVGVFLFIRHLGVQAAEHAQLEKDYQAAKDALTASQAEYNRVNLIAQGLEQKLASAAVVERQLNERLKDEVAKNGVYRACRVPATGVQLLKDARAPRSPAR